MQKTGFVFACYFHGCTQDVPKKYIHKPSATSKTQKAVISGCASRWLPNGKKIYCLVKILNRWAVPFCSFAKALILKSLTLVLISSSSTEFSRNTPHLKAASELTSWETEQFRLHWLYFLQDEGHLSKLQRVYRKNL